MSMSVNTNYTSYTSQYTKVDISNGDEIKQGNNNKIQNDSGAIYDKSGEKIDNTSYSINKMSASDRAGSGTVKGCRRTTPETARGYCKKNYIRSGGSIWESK